MTRKAGALLGLALATISAPALAVDLQMINRIADAGFNHGEVVETAAHLSDSIGPRLTNSPAMREAERWTQRKFREWGLKNVRAEGFEFGRGWWIENATVRMVAPRPINLRSIPIAWTPATNGAITAPIVVAPMAREQDFERYRGTLAGKIVLISYPREVEDATEAWFTRFSDADLKKLDAYQQPTHDPDADSQRVERRMFPYRLDAFLKAEGALAWARMSIRDYGEVHGEGRTFAVGQTPALPAVELAAEDYRRLARLAKIGPVTLEINSRVHFEDDDHNAYNILAEIPGSDPKAGYILAGAHLDSWVAGDGAGDNAAGSAMVMEAARILSSLGVRPKRTIRFALWSAEEQPYIGSLEYVRKYLGTRPAHPNPAVAPTGPFSRAAQYPVTILPGYQDLAAYFNIDNGPGKIRGIYAEGNFAAVPLLKEWLAPFASMGAATVAASRKSGTDHIGFVDLGLPAFQFIQDPLDHETRIHHSNLDTFDHMPLQDLRQNAVILASVLLSAAESEERIPHDVRPTKPRPTDPFRYPNPAR